MKKIAVLASGEGTNLEAIFEAAARGEIAGTVALVLSDQEKAPALGRARRRGVKALFVDPRGCRKRADYDASILELLIQEKIELIVLAGFMRLLSPLLVAAFPQCIINIHPSLLPSFPGLDSVRQALEHGAKITGCTVHFVDEGLDSGPIILQEAVPVLQYDSVETLHQRIHAAEYRLYPRAIDLWCREKITVQGRRCFINER